MAGYALWQLARAVLGGNLEGGEDESAWKRIGYAARGVFYGALFVSTTMIVVGADEGGDKNEEDQATAYVLDLPGGPFLVAGIGLGFLAAAAFNLYRGVTRKFREKLKLREMSEAEDRAYTVIGVVGFVARAVVFGLIGVFLVRAAYQYDPQEAVGLDGALSELAHASVRSDPARADGRGPVRLRPLLVRRGAVPRGVVRPRLQREVQQREPGGARGEAREHVGEEVHAEVEAAEADCRDQTAAPSQHGDRRPAAPGVACEDDRDRPVDRERDEGVAARERERAGGRERILEEGPLAPGSPASSRT